MDCPWPRLSLVSSPFNSPLFPAARFLPKYPPYPPSAMPRAESKQQHLGTHFYHSQFSNSQYLPSATESTASSSPPMSPASPAQSAQSTNSSSTSPAAKKKHVCTTCERAFTTSGHLARHSRVHTGERNHKCPFPGCETRCSRQDNLQQHYRIHLSPGSRRSSARSSRAKRAAANNSQTQTQTTAAASEPPSAPPPLSSPPALEPARAYSHHSTPPDSPPPLAQATLPATATLALSTPRLEPASASGRSSSFLARARQQQQQALNLASPTGQGYAYRSGTTTYQEQSQGAGFTYVHTTPVNGAGSPTNGGGGGPSYTAYAGSHDGYAMQQQQRDNSPVSITSRHSISHISHPQSSYAQSQHSNGCASPPSPASSHSVSSHTSGPPTPTYPVFHEDAASVASAYHHAAGAGVGGMMGAAGTGAEHAGLGAHHLVQQHNGYGTAGRFESPPPILAPIQDERLVRREEARHHAQQQQHQQQQAQQAQHHHQHHHQQQQQQHHQQQQQQQQAQHHHQHHHAAPSPYIHHPQPLPTEYSYHQTMALGHGAWKAESGLRKGVGALV
ncbi:unnamed protein product [Cyclocybe aegerita]|uniref:C2H2-type domain-containing protein n=1 Tax=Cyclocybe aegerita TaxID=1973307 RepID=A0A8S0XZK1_CYCAE|nr:unnamed protein product [Cyclocybe aegerita]